MLQQHVCWLVLKGRGRLEWDRPCAVGTLASFSSAGHPPALPVLSAFARCHRAALDVVREKKKVEVARGAMGRDVWAPKKQRLSFVALRIVPLLQSSSLRREQE